MDNIIEPTIDYDFSKLYLGPPTTLAGGAYFTKLMYNNNKQQLIQHPKCLTKQGFIKSGKKIYTDLMFDINDTVFINWIEKLETRCQELIFTTGQNWFETKLEKEDIESAFTSLLKIFKSGKYYLLRVNVKQNVKIYDENDKIISMDDITPEKTIISILEIQGIKFSSRNFQIEIELKQSMIVSPDPFLDECFIKKPIKKQQVKEVPNEELIEETDAFELNDFINKAAKVLDKNLDKNLDKTVESLETVPIDLEVSFENEIDGLVSKDITNNIAVKEDTNIVLDIEELEPTEQVKEDPNILKEIDLSSTLENNLETITLKKPNQVYYEIYQKARDKAKEAKKNAIVAYLEMKNIKKTYMLDDIDESDSDFEDFASRDGDSDNESLEDNFE